MSKDLNSIGGKKEIVLDYHTKTVGYEPAYLHISSFYGGIERGKCLQMSINHGEEHIQLTKENVILLRNELIKWLDEH